MEVLLVGLEVESPIGALWFGATAWKCGDEVFGADEMYGEAGYTGIIGRHGPAVR